MYKLAFPQQIVFGCGSRKKIGSLVPEASSRVLIVSGQSAWRNGTVKQIAEYLPGRAVEFFCQVEAEPSIQQVDEVRALFRKFAGNAVVAVGGGSAMDLGKVVAAASESTESTAEFFYNRKLMPPQGCFMAALPTTAGTGAEVTPNGVFTDHESGIKQSIRGGSILPALAVVDPELSISCPANVTAASGLDALTQGIESYISRNANHATRALAAQGVLLINNAIEKVYCHADDIAGRSDMSEGTMLGALAFAVSGLGAVHGLAHPLGAVTKLPHGLVCGALLPVVLKWNLPVCRKALDELAGYLHLSSAETLIGRIEQLLEQFHIREALQGIQLSGDEKMWIVKNSRSGSMRANPRDLTDEELMQILTEVI